MTFSLQTAWNLAGQAMATILPKVTAIERGYKAVGQLELITPDWVDAPGDAFMLKVVLMINVHKVHPVHAVHQRTLPRRGWPTTG